MDGDALRTLSSEVIGRSLFDLYPEAATQPREYYEGSRRRLVASPLARLHRFLLAATDQSRACHNGDAANRARIRSLSLDGAVVGTITIIDDVSDRQASGSHYASRSTRSAGADAAGRRSIGRIPVHAVARDADAAQCRARLRARILLDRQTLDHALVGVPCT